MKCTWDGIVRAMDAPRSPEQRKSDALAELTTPHGDVWVASASSTGRPHLVPLSLAWDGEHVIIAVERTAVTARNIVLSERARLGLGGTRDVVMIDVVLVQTIAVEEAPAEVAERYAAQADWDPRASGGDFAYLLLRPQRIHVWREENEIAGRTVMRDGAWLV